MRLLIVAHGSRGDVAPLVALGARLCARGHEVRMFAPPDTRAIVEERGVWYAPLGAASDRAFEAVESSPMRAIGRLAALWRDQLRSQFSALTPHVRWPEFVLSAGLTPFADAIAGQAGVPHAVAVFSAVCLPSAHHAPMPFAGARLPGMANRLLWRFIAMSTNGMARAACNEYRRAIGLGPIRDVNDVLFPRGRILLAADPELSPAPPDWSGALVQTGAWAPSDGAPLPKEIEAFIDSGMPPVYVGFGSTLVGDPEAVSSMLARVADTTEIRILHCMRRPEASARTSRYLPIGSTSHVRLFPRLAGVVHHGGAGTAAAAARAGVPQWIVPHVLDQPYQARRVHLAGLGPKSVPARRLNAEIVGRQLRSLVTDPGYRSRARALRDRLEARDPLAEAESAVMAMLARGPRPID